MARRSQAGPEQHRQRDAAVHIVAQSVGSVSAIKEAETLERLCGQLDAGLRGSDLATAVLGPIASTIGAETASLRMLCRNTKPPAPTATRNTLSSASPDVCEIPRPLATLGIPESVGDAYRETFYALDPVRRLPWHGVAEPVFADPDRPGQWLGVNIPSAVSHRLQLEFSEYRRGFLEPNGFFRHIGFCFHDPSGRMLLFDFHRGCRSAPFDRLETARARLIGRYLHGCSWKSSMLPSPVALGHPLSTREFEVAMAVAKGLANKEVAATLKISVRTVENHMRSIFAKLGISSRTQLAAVLYGAS